MKHFLWNCPFTWVARNNAGAALGSVAHLPPFQLKLGIPELDPKLKAWQGSWSSFMHSSGDWKANKIWTDASSFYPRDGALRVVGWAVVAWLAGGWVFIRGTMPPGTTVAQGEARAIQVALDRLEPGKAAPKPDAASLVKAFETKELSSVRRAQALQQLATAEADLEEAIAGLESARWMAVPRVRVMYPTTSSPQIGLQQAARA